MSLPARVTRPQPADVTFESHESGMQRVVMCPVEYGASTRMECKQQLQQQQVHLYTGEVVPADSKHNCGSTSNAFIPHGVGTLVYLVYAKCGAAASGGLPHTVVLSEYGEVEELKGSILFTFSIYRGSFSYGRRQGKGQLTVYPRYSMECMWENDAPLLDRTPCRLSLLSKTNTSEEEEKEEKEKEGGGRKKKKKQTKSVRINVASGNNDDTATHARKEYFGRISMILSDLTPHRGSLAGLAWAEQTKFVPDGVGEMLYPDGVRYCGFWQCAQQHGFGVEYDPGVNTLFMGNYEHDKREGSGALHYCSTGVVFSGNWKGGKLTVKSNAILPTWPFVLQATQWKNYENLSFDHSALLQSPAALSGIWEPLFHSFDEKLSSFTWEQHEEENNAPPTNTRETTTATTTTTTANGEEANNNNNNNKDGDEDEDEEFLSILLSMMQSKEFRALLVPFQRCYYFLYKTCVGKRHMKRNEKNSLGEEVCESTSQQHPFSNLSSSPARSAPVSRSLLMTAHDDESHPRRSQRQKTEAKSMKKLPPFLLQLRELGRNGCHGVLRREKGIAGCWSCPSWCEEIGMESSNNNGGGGGGGGGEYDGDVVRCFHTETMAESLSTRMSPQKLFERAMHDLASFVSSVWLRLLSYMVVHPSAGCDVSVSKRFLPICWDSVYSLVAPVIHELAAAAEAESVIAASLALQRCASLNRSDFIPVEVFAAGRDEVNENCGVMEEFARLFSSPAHHGRRTVEQTINGQLLCFGLHVGSKEEHAAAVYFSPADMFAALDSLYTQALCLFPRNTFLQERWMCYSVVAAFNHAEGINPHKALSPPAVLRIIHFLVSEVSPRYPFSSQGNVKGRNASLLHKAQKENFSMLHIASSGGNRRSGNNNYYYYKKKSGTDTVDDGGSEDFIGSSGNMRKETLDVMLVLSVAREGVERLRNIYPTIRFTFLPASLLVAGAEAVEDFHMTRVVYPLDELATRTRFVLLAATEWLQRHLQRESEGKGKEDNLWNVKRSAVSIPEKKCNNDNNNNNNNVSKGEEKIIPELHPHIQSVLRLPFSVMQRALKQQSEEHLDERASIHENSGMHSSTETQRQRETTLNFISSTSSSLLTSEVVLWVVDCIGGVLESPNFPADATTLMTSRRTPRQSSLSHHANTPPPPPTTATTTATTTTLQSLYKEQQQRHVDPADTLNDTEKKGVADESNDLQYQWKLFIPRNTMTPATRNILASGEETGTRVGTPAAAGAESNITSRMLTDDENLQILLLKGLLADVGICMNLHVHCCYDNEEDISLTSPVQNFFSSSGMRACDTIGSDMLATTREKTMETCVGMEASLSLHVPASFLGSRVWEVLAEAWLAARGTLRARASSFLHMKRKCIPTDLVKCVN